MSISRIAYMFLFLLIPYRGIFAQTLSVIDASDLQPIENVAVYSRSSNLVGLTNEYGMLEIKKVRGTDTLFFQHPGYYVVQFTLNNLKEDDYLVRLNDKVVILGEIVVSVSKIEEEKSGIPNKVNIIRTKEIETYNPQTTADMLSYSGNIYLQKSQMGGGSPVIRGLEANKVLLVLDGVRMNNAIYRSGHLQNVIMIDHNIIERTEVILGPGSVNYGSDALGGVMHFYTMKPKLAVGKHKNTKANALIRISSANSEQSGHVDFNIGYNKIGFLSSLSYVDFDDLRTGNIRHPSYPNFGKTFSYVTQVSGVDTILPNNDPNIQLFTNYSQVNLSQKILYKPNKIVDFLFNTSYTTSSIVPRYDRLTDTTANGLLKYAEWYYGPQEWLLSSLTTTIKQNSAFFDRFDFTLAYQNILEERNTRRYKNPALISRHENVVVFSEYLDFNKNFYEKVGDSINYDKIKHRLHYGLAYEYNNVQSTADSVINNAVIGNASTRYPDGGSIMESYAIYVTYKWNISKLITLSSGIRYTQIRLESNFRDSTFFDFPFDQIALGPEAFSESVGIVIRPTESLQINIIASTGFRSPNVDDVGKVFDSSPGNVIVPNNNLQPEYAYNGELGITQKFGSIIEISASGYYTILNDLIVRRNFKFNGQDSIYYDGVLSQVQANVNAGNAFITGFSINFLADIVQNLQTKNDINFTYGRETTSDVPLGHIPPVFGQSRLIYTYNKLQSELFIRYNGWKRIADYSPFGEDRPEQATIHGTPSWYTLNVRAGYQVNKMIRFQIALENIFDQHYKSFASGISAPGRNLIIALRGRF
ncbi:MAG: TonB-dependent receptor [Bacteroidetes bacterium]|nr:TonB-dependent receptor [Bacteroidota bacterium]